jgi:signal transduction histidine kinase
MRICLVSRDPALQAMLADLPAKRLTAVAPGEPVDDADLIVWDYTPGMDLTIPDRDRPERHLVLVERQMLSAFIEKEWAGSVCILLKPLNLSTLRAFINPASDRERLNALRTDRDALLQYVLQVNVRLQEHEQDRTNFLARALHDLRAPLTALHGYCGLLLEGQLGPVTAQQQDLLDRMRYSTSRLSRLASGMFELSVEGRVSRKLQLEQGDLGDCVNQALHELAPFIHEKQLGITAQLDAPGRALLFEPQQMQQVMVNLLENACRFTPKRGFIDIRGYEITGDVGQAAELPADGAGYRMDIRDSGPGIAGEHLDTIFEQYTSYSGSRDRSGGGLGLAICKLIVTSHGGRIWAESSESGALFSFVLPFERPMETGWQPAGGEWLSTEVAKAV